MYYNPAFEFAQSNQQNSNNQYGFSGFDNTDFRELFNDQKEKVQYSKITDENSRKDHIKDISTTLSSIHGVIIDFFEFIKDYYKNTYTDHEYNNEILKGQNAQSKLFEYFISSEEKTKEQIHLLSKSLEFNPVKLVKKINDSIFESVRSSTAYYDKRIKQNLKENAINAGFGSSDFSIGVLKSFTTSGQSILRSTSGTPPQVATNVLLASIYDVVRYIGLDNKARYNGMNISDLMKEMTKATSFGFLDRIKSTFYDTFGLKYIAALGGAVKDTVNFFNISKKLEDRRNRKNEEIVKKYKTNKTPEVITSEAIIKIPNILESQRSLLVNINEILGNLFVVNRDLLQAATGQQYQYSNFLEDKKEAKVFLVDTGEMVTSKQLEDFNKQKFENITKDVIGSEIFGKRKLKKLNKNESKIEKISNELENINSELETQISDEMRVKLEQRKIQLTNSKFKLQSDVDTAKNKRSERTSELHKLSSTDNQEKEYLNRDLFQNATSDNTLPLISPIVNSNELLLSSSTTQVEILRNIEENTRLSNLCCNATQDMFSNDTIERIQTIRSRNNPRIEHIQDDSIQDFSNFDQSNNPRIEQTTIHDQFKEVISSTGDLISTTISKSPSILKYLMGNVVSTAFKTIPVLINAGLFSTIVPVLSSVVKSTIDIGTSAIDNIAKWGINKIKGSNNEPQDIQLLTEIRDNLLLTNGLSSDGFLQFRLPIEIENAIKVIATNSEIQARIAYQQHQLALDEKEITLNERLANRKNNLPSLPGPSGDTTIINNELMEQDKDKNKKGIFGKIFGLLTGIGGGLLKFGAAIAGPIVAGLTTLGTVILGGLATLGTVILGGLSKFAFDKLLNRRNPSPIIGGPDFDDNNRRNRRSSRRSSINPIISDDDNTSSRRTQRTSPRSSRISAGSLKGAGYVGAGLALIEIVPALADLISNGIPTKEEFKVLGGKLWDGLKTFVIGSLSQVAGKIVGAGIASSIAIGGATLGSAAPVVGTVVGFVLGLAIGQVIQGILDLIPKIKEASKNIITGMNNYIKDSLTFGKNQEFVDLAREKGSKLVTEGGKITVIGNVTNKEGDVEEKRVTINEKKFRAHEDNIRRNNADILENIERRAGGGPVTVDRPYIVGENEPELFIPKTDGLILNSEQLDNISTQLSSLDNEELATYINSLSRDIQLSLIEHSGNISGDISTAFREIQPDIDKLNTEIRTISEPIRNSIIGLTKDTISATSKAIGDNSDEISAGVKSTIQTSSNVYADVIKPTASSAIDVGKDAYKGFIAPAAEKGFDFISEKVSGLKETYTKHRQEEIKRRENELIERLKVESPLYIAKSSDGLYTVKFTDGTTYVVGTDTELLSRAYPIVKNLKDEDLGLSKPKLAFKPTESQQEQIDDKSKTKQELIDEETSRTKLTQTASNNLGPLGDMFSGIANGITEGLESGDFSKLKSSFKEGMQSAATKTAELQDKAIKLRNQFDESMFGINRDKLGKSHAGLDYENIFNNASISENLSGKNYRASDDSSMVLDEGVPTNIQQGYELPTDDIKSIRKRMTGGLFGTGIFGGAFSDILGNELPQEYFGLVKLKMLADQNGNLKNIGPKDIKSAIKDILKTKKKFDKLDVPYSDFDLYMGTKIQPELWHLLKSNLTNDDELNNILENNKSAQKQLSKLGIDLDNPSNSLMNFVDNQRKIAHELGIYFKDNKVQHFDPSKDVKAVTGGKTFKRKALDVSSSRIDSIITSIGGLFGYDDSEDFKNGFSFDSVEKRALGGPVIKDTPYIVGEEGPELFTPDKTGTITPNKETSTFFNNVGNYISERVSDKTINPSIDYTELKDTWKSATKFVENNVNDSQWQPLVSSISPIRKQYDNAILSFNGGNIGIYISSKNARKFGLFIEGGEGKGERGGKEKGGLLSGLKEKFSGMLDGVLSTAGDIGKSIMSPSGILSSVSPVGMATKGLEVGKSAYEAVTGGGEGKPITGSSEKPIIGSGDITTGSNVGDKALLDQIALGEGTTDEKARKHGFESSYDVPLGYGAYGRPDKPLSQMTVGEVKEYQRQMLANPKNKWNSSAVGKYQIVGKTLRGLQSELDISDDQVFDQALQDRLGTQLLNRRGYDKWKKGELSDEQFQTNLAKEWASVARPDTGKSHYGQHTGTSSSAIQNAMKMAKMSEEEAIQQGLIQDPSKIGQVDQSLLDPSSGFITSSNHIPDDMKDLPIKLANGKTVPLSSTGAETFEDLQRVGGQAFTGGQNDPATLIATNAIRQGLGDNFDRVTAQNDDWHVQNSPNSGHTKGYKTDYTVKGISYADAHKRSAQILAEKYGLEEGKDVKFISTPHGTGDHIDMKLTSSGRSKVSTKYASQIKPIESPLFTDQPQIAEEFNKAKTDKLPKSPTTASTDLDIDFDAMQKDMQSGELSMFASTSGSMGGSMSDVTDISDPNAMTRGLNISDRVKDPRRQQLLDKFNREKDPRRQQLLDKSNDPNLSDSERATWKRMYDNAQVSESGEIIATASRQKTPTIHTTPKPGDLHTKEEMMEMFRKRDEAEGKVPLVPDNLDLTSTNRDGGIKIKQKSNIPSKSITGTIHDILTGNDIDDVSTPKLTTTESDTKLTRRGTRKKISEIKFPKTKHPVSVESRKSRRDNKIKPSEPVASVDRKSVPPTPSKSVTGTIHNILTGNDTDDIPTTIPKLTTTDTIPTPGIRDGGIKFNPETGVYDVTRKPEPIPTTSTPSKSVTGTIHDILTGNDTDDIPTTSPKLTTTDTPTIPKPGIRDGGIKFNPETGVYDVTRKPEPIPTIPTPSKSVTSTIHDILTGHDTDDIPTTTPKLTTTESDTKLTRRGTRKKVSEIKSPKTTHPVSVESRKSRRDSTTIKPSEPIKPESIVAVEHTGPTKEAAAELKTDTITLTQDPTKTTVTTDDIATITGPTSTPDKAIIDVASEQSKKTETTIIDPAEKKQLTPVTKSTVSKPMITPKPKTTVSSPTPVPTLSSAPISSSQKQPAYKPSNIFEQLFGGVASSLPFGIGDALSDGLNKLPSISNIVDKSGIPGSFKNMISGGIGKLSSIGDMIPKGMSNIKELGSGLKSILSTSENKELDRLTKEAAASGTVKTSGGLKSILSISENKELDRLTKEAASSGTVKTSGGLKSVLSTSENKELDRLTKEAAASGTTKSSIVKRPPQSQFDSSSYDDFVSTDIKSKASNQFKSENMISEGFKNMTSAMTNITTPTSPVQSMGGSNAAQNAVLGKGTPTSHEMGGMSVPIDPFGDEIIDKMFNGMSKAFFTHVREQSNYNPDHNFFES